ncbi:MAG TPA: helix-turn-helix domain-containing protein [Polyangiaceae bacterium]|jgi:chromosomal replication initiation ATPase DnaA|nr:helix-turn-helix domain-containing protein [Polyangiaceae bacterium]
MRRGITARPLEESLARAQALPEPFMALCGEVSEAKGISLGELFSRSQDRNVADARHVIAWVAHERWGYSSTRLGTLLQRDHTTMLQAVARIDIEIRIGSALGRFAARLHQPEQVRRVPGEGVVLELADGAA